MAPQGNILRILHSSDLHGDYKKLLTCTLDFDVWVDSGDFCPNYGRGPKTGGVIEPAYERRYQYKWWGYKNLGSRLANWLKGRPGIFVPGNHDFAPYAEMLRCPFGLPIRENIHILTTTPVLVAGAKWSGFREITWIAGEWPGEVHDFRERIDAVFNEPPDILITHSPPYRILDYDPGWHRGWGIPALETALCYRKHNIKAHFFGHVHPQGGKTETHSGTTFFNGSERVMLHEVNLG